jgi:hypothetical protein
MRGLAAAAPREAAAPTMRSARSDLGPDKIRAVMAPKIVPPEHDRRRGRTPHKP